MSQAHGVALSEPLRAHFTALPSQWQAVLRNARTVEAMRSLVAFVDARVAAGQRVYPAQPLAALCDSAPEQVRVVILGQDPYHGAGQAHGYAFSVPDGVRPPPSLRNILAERTRDCPGDSEAATGNLLAWSRQGVLLLNTVLTVEEGAPGSHAGQGWEIFTDAIIDAIAAQPAPKAFLLWGAHAQAKKARIEAAQSPALVLCANHPSPLSARRPPQPFVGCGHFSQVNRYFQGQGLAPIRW